MQCVRSSPSLDRNELSGEEVDLVSQLDYVGRMLLLLHVRTYTTCLVYTLRHMFAQAGTQHCGNLERKTDRDHNAALSIASV